MPKAVAEKFQVVPFAHDEERNRLWLGTIDPSNLNVADELQFALGRNVELRVCAEIVLQCALEKYYGVQRDKRFIRLSLEGAAAGRKEERSAAPPPPSSGPGGLLGRIAGASSTEELLTTVLDALGAFAQQSVFLALRGEELTGWSGRGLPCAHDTLVGARLGLRASPLSCRAFASRQPQRIRLGDEPALLLLLRDQLLMDDESDVMLLPLLVTDAATGLFILGQLREGRSADAALLGELMQRVGWRIQTLQLMDRVTAPLVGCP